MLIEKGNAPETDTALYIHTCMWHMPAHVTHRWRPASEHGVVNCLAYIKSLYAKPRLAFTSDWDFFHASTHRLAAALPR